MQGLVSSLAWKEVLDTINEVRLFTRVGKREVSTFLLPTPVLQQEEVVCGPLSPAPLS